MPTGLPCLWGGLVEDNTLQIAEQHSRWFIIGINPTQTQSWTAFKLVQNNGMYDREFFRLCWYRDSLDYSDDLCRKELDWRLLILGDNSKADHKYRLSWQHMVQSESELEISTSFFRTMRQCYSIQEEPERFATWTLYSFYHRMFFPTVTAVYTWHLGYSNFRQAAVIFF